MSFKAWIRTCSLICLLVVVAASMALSMAPYKIYDECRLGAGAGNAYYIGGVFDGTAYVGHIFHGAQQWGDQQIGGTGCLNATDNLLPLTPNNVAKAAFPLGGWIYMSNGAGNLCRVKNWNDAVAPQELPSPVLIAGSSVPVYCDCITTDGTYIYVSSGTGTNPANGPYNTIFKYSVNHEAGTISLIWQSAPAGSTTSTHRFRAISYYNGKLYTSNNKGATCGHIFEVDCGTGAYTDLTPTRAAAVAGDPYQAVRYGNKIFMVSLDDCLYTFEYSGGSWSQIAGDNLGVSDMYGIAVKGDGTNAKYAWITHTPGYVSFWDLDPQFVPGSLGDARKSKNGYPVIAQNAVVTKTGAGEYWVEDKDRASGARVICIGTLPTVGNTITLKGGMSSTDSGEKVFNPIEVTEGAPAVPAIQPVFVTNKNMGSAVSGPGLATDGMLVTVSGKITHAVADQVSEKNVFYIDDGCGVASDVVGVKGVKVTAPGLDTWENFPPIVMGYPYVATVTGIVRIEKLADGTITRRIQAFNLANIQLTPLF